MRRGDFIRGALSAGALALLFSHLFFRGVVNVDAISVALLAVVVLPWLGDIFESIDFPGGGGVKFRERVKAAGEVVAASAPPQPQPTSPPAQAPRAAQPGTADSSRSREHGGRAWERPLPSTDDPNLQLVALRIEIERRLAALVEKHGIKARTLNDMLRAAEDAHLLDDDVTDALRTLIRAGNMAAHGRTISRDLGDWVIEKGPAILRALDVRLLQGTPGENQ